MADAAIVEAGGDAVIILLGEPADQDLLWLAAALHERGAAVTRLSPADILVDSRLTYRIDQDRVSSSLRLRDGRAIEDDLEGLVINRLTEIPTLSSISSPADEAYLREEWRAALAAWLRTLRCPILNPPRAGSLGGPAIVTSAWRSLARAHGLPSCPWTSHESSSVLDPVDLLCVAGSCLDSSGSADPRLRARLCRMAEFVGAPLLGAQFDRGQEWLFVGATVAPPLERWGQPLVDAIVQLSRTRLV